MLTSPLEQFEVLPLKGVFYLFDLFGISVTNFTVSAFFVIVIVLLISVLGVFKVKFLATPGQFFLEFIYNFVYGLFLSNLSEEEHKYFPYVFSLFVSVFGYNLLGLLPYGFTVTSQIIVTTFFSFSTFLGLIWIGIKKHGLNFIGLFFPPEAPSLLAFLLVPIEIVSFFSRPFSLAIRLFANMTAGHVLLKILAGFAIVLFVSIPGLNFNAVKLFAALAGGVNLFVDVFYPAGAGYKVTFSAFNLDYTSYNYNLFVAHLMYYYSHIFHVEDILENSVGKKSFWIKISWRILSYIGYLSPLLAMSPKALQFTADFTAVLMSPVKRTEVLAIAHAPVVYYIYEGLVFYNSLTQADWALFSQLYTSFFVIDITVLSHILDFITWVVISLASVIVPVALLSFFIVLEIFVSVLQAYVFTILIVIYLRDVIDLH